jgi:hypothetical protein
MVRLPVAFLSLLLLWTSVAEAAVRMDLVSPASQAGAAIGVGSRIRLEFEGDPRPRSGLFLGDLVAANGRAEQRMLLDLDRKKVVILNRNEVLAPRAHYQKIVRPYDQVDGTCTGYAMDHMMEQIARNRLAGNEALQAQFSSEKGRTQFLVRAINDYYISTVHRTSIRGILRTYGAEFGLNCILRKFQDPARAMAHVAEQVMAGTPVLVSFDIGPNMYDADLPLMTLTGSKASRLDGRLWLPRKIGERNSGGHSVVAVAAFEALGKKRLLMLDSDWAEPRIWDLEQALGGRTDIEAVEFHSCN